MTETRNLYQRLSAITAEVEAIKPTGKTAFKTPALSIADVEDALRELLAKHGVVTGYAFLEKPEAISGNLWMVSLKVWLCNADQPDDKREDMVADIGNSPSGAVSFALKRYLRALFHLADEDDTTVPRERKTALSEAPGNGEGAAGSARPAQSTSQAMGAPSSSPARTAVATLTPGIPSRDALLMQVSILAKAKFGPTWREDAQKLAKSLVARDFKLIADLSVEELEQVIGELEQVP